MSDQTQTQTETQTQSPPRWPSSVSGEGVAYAAHLAAREAARPETVGSARVTLTWAEAVALGACAWAAEYNGVSVLDTTQEQFVFTDAVRSARRKLEAAERRAQAAEAQARREFWGRQ